MPLPVSTRPGIGEFPAFADTAQSAAAASPATPLDVCHPGLALRAVLYVQAVLGLSILMQAGGWLQALALSGPVVLAGLIGTLSWLLAVCAAQRPLSQAAAPLRWLLVLGLGAAAAALGFGLLLPLRLVEAGATRWLAVPLAGAVLAGSLWTWLVLRVRSRLPAEAAARLAELQARIRPHFLFNALNTAVALVRVDPSQAEVVLEDLAQLFRMALEDHGSAVSLAEEVDLAQRYLAIEQLRFGARLQISWQLDPAANRARVPPLLLQPLVENAVRHGVEPSPEPCRIQVITKVRRGQAVIRIVNSLSGRASRPGHGMALKNVRQRLALLHDVAAQFQVRTDGHRFEIEIEVPL
jgi:two-component system sensor histidine kinase AlgZ